MEKRKRGAQLSTDWTETAKERERENERGRVRGRGKVERIGKEKEKEKTDDGERRAINGHGECGFNYCRQGFE